MAELKVGDRVIATDAGGREHHGVVGYGPSRDRYGVRGVFVKVWIMFDGKAADPMFPDGFPWPVADVRPAD